MPFNPSLDDIKLSVNVIVEGVTMTYSIDHQTWPTTHTHNGKTHVFDETSPIRLHSINYSEDDVDALELNKLSESEIEVWKAKHLIGKEWEEDEEDGEGKQPAVKVEPREARFHCTRSRSPNFGRSSKAPSKASAKKRKANTFFGTSDDEFGSGDVTNCDSDGEDGIPSPSRFSNTVIRAREPAVRVIVNSSIHAPQQPLAQNYPRTIKVVSTGGQEVYLNVHSSATGSKVVRTVLESIGRADEVNTVRAFIDGLEEWPRNQTVADIGLWDDMVPVGSAAPHKRYVVVLFDQCGGKPVIYLYPSRPMSVDVTLSLCPQCTSILSILYRRS